MNYDPIKKRLGVFFNSHTFLRKLFYFFLDILLLRAWYIKREVKLWAKTAAHDSYILDAGAGFGQYVYFLSKFKTQWSVTGIDVKKEQVDDCNSFFHAIGKAPRVKYEEGDLTKFISRKPADLILSVDVMEHIEEDVLVFENLYKSLGTNGMLLISTPSDMGGSDVHEHGDESFVGEHVRDGYSKSDITEKLTHAGFSRVEIMYSYGTWGSLSWKLSMKLPITMLNISFITIIILPFYYSVVYPFCLLFNLIDVLKVNKKGTGLIVKAYK